ncbi:gamma-glutamyltranspeptidase 1-like [Pyrus ussuriensis x Pyrus communis]|uniref:Glutathione hydrolase n=1 Tax=Pyrus ussuriensis x Pyrus communis TaxID=2448454 RepID=A0A5N5H315_9ROSA|nr:gamma-glutamyltranspeptidase 1-like [Pyrus ussuriensis x Pyrus communis]
MHGVRVDQNVFLFLFVVDWMMSLLTIALVFLSLLLPTSSATSGSAKSRPEVISVRHGAVATDDRRCSRIGKDVLREGGNAVDVSVAAALCLGVVSPASSGIGGGAFMLVRLASGEAHAFDMRETAPLLASENMYAANVTLKGRGALSVAIPGELAGLHEAWKQHGRLPWDRLVRPAERLARLGFKISPYLHRQMVTAESGILANEGLRHIFTSNGSLLQTGEICRNIKLAETLNQISKFGPVAMYNGSIGSKLIRDVQKLGGILTMKDLQTYRVRLRKPVSADTLGLKILAMPPPSGGPPLILMLNILSQYGNASGVPDPLWIHREIESLKHVFAVRMNLGDPEFVNVTKVLADMLSPEFAEQMKKTIYDNMTFDPSHYGGRWSQINDHGTSHLSIVDPQGNAVSMTTTVNGYFGAHILSSSTGIVLNNEMDDFSIPGNVSASPPPAPPNFIRPGKRPLSSMTPAIVLKDDQLNAVVGASGGVFIIPATAEVLLNHFARGMDPLSSVMAPRVYHQLLPNVVRYENWTSVTGDHFEVPTQIRKSLQKKGHILEPLTSGAICQFIVHKASTENEGTPEILAVSDPRKGGVPAGF